MTKRPTKQGRRQTAKRGDRPKRKSGPSKKEVATFAALLKKGHNKRS